MSSLFHARKPCRWSWCMDQVWGIQFPSLVPSHSLQVSSLQPFLENLLLLCIPSWILWVLFIRPFIPAMPGLSHLVDTTMLTVIIKWTIDPSSLALPISRAPFSWSQEVLPQKAHWVMLPLCVVCALVKRILADVFEQGLEMYIHVCRHTLVIPALLQGLDSPSAWSQSEPKWNRPNLST